MYKQNKIHILLEKLILNLKIFYKNYCKILVYVREKKRLTIMQRLGRHKRRNYVNMSM